MLALPDIRFIAVPVQVARLYSDRDAEGTTYGDTGLTAEQRIDIAFAAVDAAGNASAQEHRFRRRPDGMRQHRHANRCLCNSGIYFAN